MRSFKKKISTLVKKGIDPVVEGMGNYANPKNEVELLADKRLLTCIGCPMFKKEPVKFLRVKDKRLKKASEMFCDDCGCTLPYKLRQSISKCDKWKE